MVECIINLDLVFGSLSDTTRRDILRRVSRRSLSISALADGYRMTFAATAKHVGLLEKAGLVSKRRQGKRQMVRIVPKTVEKVREHLGKYQELWEERFEALDEVLRSKK